MTGLLNRWLDPPTGETLLFSNRDLFYLFLPLVLQQFLVILAGFTDSLMAAALGEAAVSGISLIDNIMVLVILTFVALSTGGAVVMGQYYGRGNLEEAREGGRQLIWSNLLLSFLAMLAFYLCEDPILYRLYGSSSPEVLACAGDYMRIMLFNIPFIAAFQAGSAVFGTVGNTKLPMVIVFLADLLNIAGNYLAIFILRWGVTGTALATLLSRIFSAAVVLFWACHSKFRLRVPSLLQARPQWDLVRRILSVGIPFAIENALFQLGKVLVVTVVTLFGTSALAANAVGTVLTNFQAMPGIAINGGMTTVASRCLGARNVAQCQFYTRKILLLSSLGNLLATILTLVLWPLITVIYGFAPETMAMAWDITFWHGTLEVLVWPLAFTLPVVFRAAGDARFAMYNGVAVMMLVRVVGAYVLAVPCHLGMFGTWIAMFLDWFVRAAIYIPHYRSGRYLRHRVI
jgi:putative MATE family efflux protein